MLLGVNAVAVNAVPRLTLLGAVIQLHGWVARAT